MKKIYNISYFWLLTSLFLLIYTFYKDNTNLDATKNYYVKYYIISFLFLLFSLSSFFFKKNFKKKIFNIFIFFILSIYTIEICLVLNKKNLKLNGLDKFSYYQKFKLSNPNSVLAIDPYNFLNEVNQNLMPLSSISNKLTIHCNELDFFSSYITDRFGFNNPDSQWDEKITDFVLVGGRFAHGDCVNEEDNISGNLRKFSLNNTAINLGYGGNGPLMEYASLVEYLPALNVKKVIWLYCERNDLAFNSTEGLNIELNNSILLKYLKDKNFSQNLRNRQHEIDIKVSNKLENMLQKINTQRKHNELIKFIKVFEIRNHINQFLSQRVQKKQIYEKKISQDFKNIIIEAKNFVNSRGAEFYFVYITDKTRYTKPVFDIKKNDYQKVIDFLVKSEINFIDLHAEFFNKEKDPLSYFAKSDEDLYTHFNKKGYNSISKLIFEKTKQ